MLPHLRRPAADPGAGPRRAGRAPVLREELPVAPPGLGRHRARQRGHRRHARAASSTTSPPLVWLANLAALELHTHQWTLDDPAHPTAMVIDLDPGEPATIIDCCRVALDLRDTLAQLDLACVVKTSGGKGLHLSVPIHGSDATDDDTKRFALALGQLLESRDPERVLVDMTRRQTAGQGVRRLEPERPAQDDGVRVLAAPARPPDGVDAARLVGGAKPRSTPATTTRSRSKRPTCSHRVDAARRPLRRLADAAPGAARALGSPPWSSPARSRSSPVHRGASAPRPRSCSRSAGCKVACAARATDDVTAADSRHDRRHRAPHRRGGRRRDRGADEPRARRRGRAHGRDDARALRSASTSSSTTPRSRSPATSRCR